MNRKWLFARGGHWMTMWSRRESTRGPLCTDVARHNHNRWTHTHNPAHSHWLVLKNLLHPKKKKKKIQKCFLSSECKKMQKKTCIIIEKKLHNLFFSIWFFFRLEIGRDHWVSSGFPQIKICPKDSPDIIWERFPFPCVGVHSSEGSSAVEQDVPEFLVHHVHVQRIGRRADVHQTLPHRHREQETRSLVERRHHRYDLPQNYQLCVWNPQKTVRRWPEFNFWAVEITFVVVAWIQYWGMQGKHYDSGVGPTFGLCCRSNIGAVV